MTLIAAPNPYHFSLGVSRCSSASKRRAVAGSVAFKATHACPARRQAASTAPVPANTVTVAEAVSVGQNFNNAILALYDGLIRIPEHMPLLETLLNELATFPGGKFDDQVDALSIIGAKRERVLELARQHAERYGRWTPEERARRSKAPVDEPARPRLKPHEQRFRLRRGLPI